MIPESSLRVTIRIHNSYLVRYREKYGLTQKEMAKLCDCHFTTYREIESLKKYPVSARTGTWSEVALSISGLIGPPPEVIFPEAFKYIRSNFVKRDMPVESFLPISAQKLALPPDLGVTNQELQTAVNRVLRTLTPREEKILSMRNGLHGYDIHTVEEIAIKFCVTRERIKQIEMKALGKLRHPSRSNSLRDWKSESL